MHPSYLIPVAVVTITIGCTTSAPEVPALPSVNEVEEIKVRITWPHALDKNPDEFSIPSELIAATLRLFDSPVYEELPPEKFLTDVATLRIICKNGQSCNLRVVFFGKEPARFLLDGIACMRNGPYEPIDFEASEDGSYEMFTAESTAIYAFLKAIHAGDEKATTQSIEELNKSAGRKP